MKLIFKSTLASLALMTFMGCKEKQETEIDTSDEVKQVDQTIADNTDQAFMDVNTDKIWHNYLQIKTAFVESDSSKVKSIAAEISDNLSEERTELKSLAQQISQTDDLEEQRRLFSDFTQKVGPMFKEGLSVGTIYEQYCPMAFDNKGASWFSDVSEIRNPYFGDKMLKCGKVTQTIEK